jgi:hypothetical protein
MLTSNKNQKGFVALFTVLLVSVILSMAVGIASISLKEIVLSSSASEGNKSFYAADAGIECALYFDRIANPPPNSFLSNLRCNDSLPIISNAITTDDSDEAYSFTMPFGEESELCADVLVERNILGAGFSTRIESKGSNVPCDDDNNPKKVERSVRVTY